MIFNCNFIIETYRGFEVKLLGLVKLNCYHKNNISVLKFVLVDDRTTPIWRMCEINLIKRVERINGLEFKSNISKEEFIKLNKDVFENVWKLDKKFETKIKEGVMPVIKTGRRLSQSTWKIFYY